MTKMIAIVIAAALVIGAALYWYTPTASEPTTPTAIKETIPYNSAKLGLSFEYPKGYFIVEHDTGSPQRTSYAIVVVPDTQTNRDLMSGKIKDSDGPPTITIQAFQNNLDHYTTESWVRGTNDSNFKLSPDGILTPARIGGGPGVQYRWSGLYEGITVATAWPDFVYAFSVSYNAPSDQIIKDFVQILTTVEFTPAQ